MAVDMEALASGMNEEIKRQNVVLDAYVRRVAALEATIVTMHLSVPGGTVCDPQAIADELREIAKLAGVDVGEN